MKINVKIFSKEGGLYDNNGINKKRDNRTKEFKYR